MHGMLFFLLHFYNKCCNLSGIIHLCYIMESMKLYLLNYVKVKKAKNRLLDCFGSIGRIYDEYSTK